MGKQDIQNAVDLLSSKKKAHVKLIGNELYRNKILSVFSYDSKEFVLTVNFKNMVKAIQIASKVIKENNLEVDLRNVKYWEVHAKDFYDSRDKGIEM